MTTVPARPRPSPYESCRVSDPGEEDWVAVLSTPGIERDEAIRRLHQLMLRAARHQAARMPSAAHLGASRWEETVQTAADEATVAVLARLSSFEGRSRFTTWAFKFGILHAAVEVRRAAWRQREVNLDLVAEPLATTPGPERVAEGAAFTAAVAEAVSRVLTSHQRLVLVALLVNEVPIDVLADRLGSNRNAIYKTLHDARVRLRAELARRGFLTEEAAR